MGEHEGVAQPDSVTVALFKDTQANLNKTDFTPEKVGAEVVLNTDNNWTHIFTADKFDADGNESTTASWKPKYATTRLKLVINAMISVPNSWITIANWIGSVTGGETSGFTITNYYVEDAFTVTYRFVGDTSEDVTAPADNRDYKQGDRYTVASVAEVDGWTFDGWYPYYNYVILYSDKVDQNMEKQIGTSLMNWNATYYGKWPKEGEQESAALTVTEGAEVQRRVLNEETGMLEWATVNSQPLMTGNKITYTIYVKNNAAADVKGFTITDTFGSTGKLTLDAEFSDFIFEDNKDRTYTTTLKDDYSVGKNSTIRLKLNYVVQDGDKTDKWYTSYENTIQTNHCVSITNRYAKNAVVVNKEIVEIARNGQSIYSNRDGSNTGGVPALRAEDTIEYKISVYNNATSNNTVKIYDR